MCLSLHENRTTPYYASHTLETPPDIVLQIAVYRQYTSNSQLDVNDAECNLQDVTPTHFLHISWASFRGDIVCTFLVRFPNSLCCELGERSVKNRGIEVLRSIVAKIYIESG